MYTTPQHPKSMPMNVKIAILMVIKPLWWHNVTDEYDIKPDQYEKMNKYYISKFRTIRSIISGPNQRRYEHS
jgi:hypothetical protein